MFVGGSIMKCERCGKEMEKFKINWNFNLGRKDKPLPPGYAETDVSVNVHSAYVCPECGKVEFNIFD